MAERDMNKRTWQSDRKQTNRYKEERYDKVKKVAKNMSLRGLKNSLSKTFQIFVCIYIYTQLNNESNGEEKKSGRGWDDQNIRKR